MADIIPAQDPRRLREIIVTPRVDDNETPNQIHGRLLEGVHIAEFTLERAWAHLEWLLDGDRWQHVGSGYSDVNEFLYGIKLDDFRILAEQRQRIVRRIRELQPASSNRRIAGVLGVDEGTIRRDAAENSAPSSENANDHNGPESAAAENSAPLTLDVGAGHCSRTLGTGNNEWFTPSEYITLARNVLVEIDLDPASHPKAQELIRAGHFFTKDDSGLDQEWHGRVWLNPPYAQPLIADFVSKMVAERKAGRVTAGIMLTLNNSDTAWFHEAAAAADAICFTRGRVPFYGADGQTAAPVQGHTFFYFGPDVEVFAAEFQAVGFVVRLRDHHHHDGDGQALGDLTHAWDHAGSEARRQFMLRVGLRPDDADLPSFLDRRCSRTEPAS